MKSQYEPKFDPKFDPKFEPKFDPKFEPDYEPEYGQVSKGASNYDPFSSRKRFYDLNEFLDSSSLVAKFAFLLLVIFVFVIALRAGSALLKELIKPAQNPVLIKGMIDSKQMQYFPQDPSIVGSVPIMRSDNKEQGMEFTWSVWIYIDDFSYKREQYKHVFHKGNDNINITEEPIGLNQPNNAPGLYIKPHTNDLAVIMNTFDKINDEVTIKGIPLNKWVNVIIRLNKQNQLDIYINGTLTKRHILQGVAKQNYGNVYASMNGGFSGHTSELRYFNSAIGANKIRNIVNKGPNLRMDSNTNVAKNKPHYFSNKWYLYK